jgi:hypothetical protein
LKAPSKRKAQIIQIAFFLVVLLVISVTALISTKISRKVMDAVQESDLANEQTTDLAEKNAAFAGITDYGLVFVAVLLSGILLFTSWLIPSHPVFIIVNFIGIFFLILIAMILSNVYGELVQGDASAFSEEAGDFPKTTFMLQQLPWICVIVTALSTIIMLAKPSSGQNGGYQ